MECWTWGHHPAANVHIDFCCNCGAGQCVHEANQGLQTVMTAMEPTEVNGNPLGLGYASRGEWAKVLAERLS